MKIRDRVVFLVFNAIFFVLLLVDILLPNLMDLDQFARLFLSLGVLIFAIAGEIFHDLDMIWEKLHEKE